VWQQAIISVMGNITAQHLKGRSQDFPNIKLMGPICLCMSDFKLNVESPFSPLPPKGTLQKASETLEYPQNFPKYKGFTGNNIKRMIDVAVKWGKGRYARWDWNMPLPII